MVYVFWGKVIKGKSRGKELGFRTANVRLHKAIAEGVYVSECKVGRNMYKAVSFVGAAETFGETEVFAETYIFDFDKDIYGKWISVRLLKKIRGSKKFKSKEELIEAIERDVTEAREYFRER
jgi:riboflavin kinase/FMN adenylyltransferase